MLLGGCCEGIEMNDGETRGREGGKRQERRGGKSDVHKGIY